MNEKTPVYIDKKLIGFCHRIRSVQELIKGDFESKYYYNIDGFVPVNSKLDKAIKEEDGAER